MVGACFPLSPCGRGWRGMSAAKSEPGEGAHKQLGARDSPLTRRLADARRHPLPRGERVSPEPLPAGEREAHRLRFARRIPINQPISHADQGSTPSGGFLSAIARSFRRKLTEGPRRTGSQARQGRKRTPAVRAPAASQRFIPRQAGGSQARGGRRRRKARDGTNRRSFYGAA
jgi:hypothetical protein